MEITPFSRESYVQLQQWLDTHHPHSSVAAIHGAISAAIACRHDKDISELVTYGVLPDLTPAARLSTELGDPDVDPLRLLQQIYTVTRHQLTNTEFDYQLVLPDDDQPMKARLQALADWCDAFTMSYSIFAAAETMHTDIKSMLEIMAAIQSADPTVAAELPDDEAFEILSDSIRLGIIDLHTEQHGVSQQSVPSDCDKTKTD